MNKELEKKLMDAYPKFFEDMYGDPMSTCMAWGCAHGDGWYSILENACKELAKVAPDNFKFAQIKEKFGELRLYTLYGNAATNKIVGEAEKESLHTCEHCGTKGNVTTEGSWIQTLCDECRNKP